MQLENKQIQKHRENEALFLNSEDGVNKNKNEFSIYQSIVHYRGISTLFELLNLDVTDFYLYFDGALDSTKYLKEKESFLNKSEIIKFLDFAVSDLSNVGGSTLYVAPKDNDSIFIMLDYQQDLSLVISKDFDGVSKIKELLEMGILV